MIAGVCTKARRIFDGRFRDARDKKHGVMKGENTMVTIRFGSGNEVTKPDGFYHTVGQILDDQALLGVLGAGANTDAVIDGAIVDRDYPVEDGDIVSLQTRANIKGN